jgi:hypothetical protein
MDNAPPTTHRITEFYRWHKEGRLELKPPYQRKPVWSHKNKSFLLDSLLNGLPVPEIYMQVKTDSKGNTKYEIVDGQQRLRAIFEYIDGEYEILEDEESPDYRGKEFTELADGDKQNLWNYQLVTRELRTNSDNEVRGIFGRLNKNVLPLMPQELRHATYAGHFIKLVEQLADDPFWSDNQIATPVDIRRMKDAEFVSELLVGAMCGEQDGTKELDKYYELYDTDFKDKDKWEKQFRKVQQIIEDVFGDLRGTHWNTKSDLYALFLAISNLLDNHIILADKYLEMRKDLTDFRRLVNVEKGDSKHREIREYYDTIGYGRTAGKEQRAKRVALVKRIILSYVIPKDIKRGFTPEQRQLVWDLSKDKICAKCRKKVEWVDYETDHKVPHSKGGLTIVSNGQVTHKLCNASKGNK